MPQTALFSLALVLASAAPGAAAADVGASALPAPAAAAAKNADFYRNKLAVVTGAHGGVGLALVRQLLASGATVYAGVHRPSSAEALAQAQRDCGGELHVVVVDIDDEASVAAFRQQIKAPFVDVLIHAAGVNVDGKHKVLDAPDDRLLKSFAVNAFGPVRLTAALSDLLHTCGTPRVVAITSVMGSIGDNRIGGSPAYRMSKAAVNMFIKELAIEEPSLIALAVHPGWVKTKMGGVHADIEPETSARGILQVIAAAQPRDSGTFYRYDGGTIVW